MNICSMSQARHHSTAPPPDRPQHWSYPAAPPTHSKTLSAFARSFAPTSTPSSIRTRGQLRMTSPRYASRPRYASFGRSCRNFASSDAYVQDTAGALGLETADEAGAGASWWDSALGPSRSSASDGPRPCPRCFLFLCWLFGSCESSPNPPKPPSDGWSAPETSLTMRGRYHPSVHGFILSSSFPSMISRLFLAMGKG